MAASSQGIVDKQSIRRTSEQDASTSGRRRFDAFPYAPYGIQQEFMDELYDTLSSGGIGLFESPTGTGKTLSLLCGTLKWLGDDKGSNQEVTDTAVAADVPDWMATFQTTSQEPVSLVKEGARARQGAIKPKPQAASNQAEKGAADELEEFLPGEWISDSEEEQSTKRRRVSGSGSSSESDGPVEAEARKPRQVYFCSRTHSQLSQVVGELKKTAYAGRVSLAALASRQALCINKDVLKLQNAAWINEKCLDLQKPAKEKKKARKAGRGASSCPFMKVKQSEKQELKDRILSEEMDVEDLNRLGSRKGVCPYYASRSAVPGADVVLLPYSALLSKDTRDALGVQLSGSVLVVDEAHNLVQAINSAHSALISLQQLQTAQAQLAAYHQRFQSRLAPGNEHNIQLLSYVTDTLISFLRRSADKAGLGSGGAQPAAEISNVNTFLFSTGLDNLNLFRLVRYAKESKVLFKIAGFADALAAKEGSGIVHVFETEDHRSAKRDEEEHTGRGTGALQALIGFFSGLNNRDEDGRIITDAAAGTFKFVLLNAASHFSEVLDVAHAVVLASGTLAPVASLQRLLFPARQVRLFSCGHVVPTDQLLAIALGTGPSGTQLDFRHPQRSQPATIDHLGRLLINICQVVPQGVVVFFPSFSYAADVEKAWEGSGIWAQLVARKRVFKEPRKASDVETVLTQYAESITAVEADEECSSKPAKARQAGAVLLCVVGGKMSEGINFGDGLGRCVVMVGMPFPNPSDPELLERMRFLDCKDSAAAAAAAEKQATTSGREFYEDLCMKAVNQCIGRVVRHKKDWAAIVLADTRWAADSASGSPREKLPGWIQKSLMVAGSFGAAYLRLARFCREQSQKQN